jgi:hypothetical protein
MATRRAVERARRRPSTGCRGVADVWYRRTEVASDRGPTKMNFWLPGSPGTRTQSGHRITVSGNVSNGQMNHYSV